MKYAIDPEFHDMLPLFPLTDFSDPVAMRAEMEAMIVKAAGGGTEEGVEIEDIDIDCSLNSHLENAPPLTLRIYRPEGQPPSTAGLLYIHGGGFAVGSINSEHLGAVALCRSLKVVVVSVDYRLAPEDPYPAGLEDCYTGLCWLHENASELGIDNARVGVMGGSAGGGLSAALALLVRDRGGPALCFQCLGIPELDDRLQTDSMKKFTDTPLWNYPSAVNSWKYYLGDAYTPGSDDVPCYAAPARAEDLSGLPPAYVSTMEFDPLRDEGIDYAVRLLKAGVNVELHSYPGTFHGSFMANPNAAVCRRENEELKVALRRGLGLPMSE